MRFVLIVIAVAALAGCRAEKRADVEVARRAIDVLNVKMEGWYVTEEADSVASLFAADAWMMPPNAAPVVGINAIREYWRNMLGMGQWTFDFNTEGLRATDSAVVERGTFTVKFAPAPNAPLRAFEDRGSYLTVWERQNDGSLRILWQAVVSSLRRDWPARTGTGPRAPRS